MNYSEELTEMVQEQLNANIRGVDPDKVRQLLETHYDGTAAVVEKLIGRELVIDDLVIPGTINNQRYYAKAMYNMFMEELENFN